MIPRQLVSELPVAVGLLIAFWASSLCAAPMPAVMAAPAQKSPTNGDSVRFTILFSEAVEGFTAGDVVVSRGTAEQLVEDPASGGTAFELTVSSIASDGLVCVTLLAAAAVGLDGSPSLPTAEDAACVTVDRAPPLPPELSLPAAGSAIAAAAPKFSWTAASDPSGIKNYRIDIDGPTGRDIYTTRTSYSPSLGEGAYAWRVNCRDQAGNVSDWTAWRALTVDRTPPSAVSLASPSHVPGAWTNEPEIEIAASGGDDALSGLAGYAVEWSQQPTEPASGGIHREPGWGGEKYTPPNDGEWWCHVCAIDRAGNRAPSAHSGPFCIDRAPPALGGAGNEIRLPNDRGRRTATADWSCVIATDAFDPAPTISFSVPTGSLFPMGRSSVIVTLADRSGNVLVHTISVVVYNTEPPSVRIDWPAEGDRIPVGKICAPRWSAESVAPIETVRLEGAAGEDLDTRSPGRHRFAVTVVDSSGLVAAASVEYIVVYADRRTEILRVRPDGFEERLYASDPADLSGAGDVAVRLSEWLRVRCRVDAQPEGALRPPIAFSLVRTDPSSATEPILERTGILADDGATYSVDLPLVVFRPGQYTLWLGYVDGTFENLSFRLVR